MSMPCRISNCMDDCYAGIDPDGNYVTVRTDGQTGEVLEVFDSSYEDDSIQDGMDYRASVIGDDDFIHEDIELCNSVVWAPKYENDLAPIDLLYQHVDNLRAIYGGKK